MSDALAKWEPLDRALEGSLAPLRAPGRRPVVLFSGGVDSGLLAWELRHVVGASLFTVGVPGSEDLKRAGQVAPLFSVPWVGHALTDGELVDVYRKAAPELVAVPVPLRGIYVALAAAFAAAPPGTLVCGQGADELFLGYAHYRGLSAEEAAKRSSEDLGRLEREDWPRARRLAERCGREVVAPYLAPEFVQSARRLPTRAHLPDPVAKPVLRGWAVHRGLPEPVAERPKRAVQFGSGVDRWLRRNRPSLD